MQYRLASQAEVTIASLRVPLEEASRFGTLTTDNKYRIKSFLEKPQKPPSDLANMGVYIFNRELLDKVLWVDHQDENSSHDFGKDILPKMLADGVRMYAYPYSGYWMDVGTIQSYWQAHLDLLSPNPPLKLYDRSWIIHTRTEERPPSRIPHTAHIYASMLSDGCFIQENTRVESSVISPGVNIRPGAVVRESIIMTDTVIESGAIIERAIIDKRCNIGSNARIGGGIANPDIHLAVIGKNSVVPAGMVVEPGAEISTDVTESDYPEQVVRPGKMIETKRQPYEI